MKDGRFMACEICDEPVVDLRLDPDNVLQQCVRCGHLMRQVTRSPAGHRDAAYGGEPSLDRIRLGLTYRTIRRRGRPASVFEVGFGTGALLRRFLDDGACVAGADPGQLGLSVDRTVARAGRLFTTPVEQVDPGQIQVDLVYGIHVLEHVQDPGRTLRQAHRLLRPGGQIQFFTPAGDSDGLRRYGKAWWMLEDPTHVRFFTARSAVLAAERAGFVQVRVERPILDSLTTDVASLARRLRRQHRPAGALSSRAVLGAAVASAPIVAATRVVRPSARPTLQLIARRAAR